MRATSCTRHPNAHWVNPCSKAAPLALHLGLWAVCAGRRFIVPAALLVFIQDVCGLTRKDLLCSSTLGCLTRRVMAGERLRECAVDAIGPSAIMLDDLIPELAHVGFLIFVVSTLARAFRPLQRAYIGVALRENGRSRVSLEPRPRRRAGSPIVTQPQYSYWTIYREISTKRGVPDPAAATGTEAEVRLAFADTYWVLNNRIGIFVTLPLRSLDQLTLQRQLDSIGKAKDAGDDPASAA
jgi:hypothetical protein